MKLNKVYSQSYTFPAVILYTLLFIIPCIAGMALSMTDWNVSNDVFSARFIWFENYKEIFTPENSYLKYMGNTVIFAVATTLFEVLIGLGLALLLNEEFKSKKLLRTIYFLPQAISPLIIGIMFSSIFHPETGALNILLRASGLGFLEQNWLADPNFVLGSVISVEVWRYAGLNMVIFLAGLQMIPKSYYEAANIDGANYWKCLIKITIPYLLPSITINSVLNIIHGLRVFDIVFTLTGGGPGDMTEVIFTAIYREFSMGRYATSTALGVIMFIFTASVALLMLKLLSRKDVED